MSAIDMNLACGSWLLVVLVNEVRRFDLDLIHAYIPQHMGESEIQGFEPAILPYESEVSDVIPTTRPMPLEKAG
jgi:hypothetical protein